MPQSSSTSQVLWSLLWFLMGIALGFCIDRAGRRRKKKQAPAPAPAILVTETEKEKATDEMPKAPAGTTNHVKLHHGMVTEGGTGVTSSPHPFSYTTVKTKTTTTTHPTTHPPSAHHDIDKASKKVKHSKRSRMKKAKVKL